MIRTIKVDLNAAYPNMPLEPVNVFAGSAASFTICNVPRSVGDRAITLVALEFKTRGGVSETLPAVRVGSAWEVTIPASRFQLPYSAALGVRIVGIGNDENKSGATWVLGVADLNVLNNQGQVTPGADAGDVKHSEFADLDPDTSSLADVITRLKGSAMSLAIVLTSLIVSFSAVAAFPVTPVYTNHNRVAGNVQTMTNIQEWAEAVEAAISDGGGGVNTNAVQDIIKVNIETNLLCTVAAAMGMKNCAVATAKAYADMKFLSAEYNDRHKIEWIESPFVQLKFYGAANFNSDVTIQSLIVSSPDLMYLGDDLQTLPSYLSRGTWNTATDRFAKMSEVGVSCHDVTNIAEAVASSQFTTNNDALVSVVTNLAPSKARGISLADPVRHCNWYQCVTNGVFFWLVEE